MITKKPKGASKHIVFLAIIFFIPAMLFAQNNSDAIVYLSASGAKYHLRDCSTLKKTKNPIKISEAIGLGKTPCSVCNPPQMEKIAAAAILAQSPLYRVNAYNLKSCTQADIKKMIAAKVVRHVDGDTIEIEITNPPQGLRQKEKIRMIGVDTPETVHPNKSVEYFGKEASDYTKAALLGKTVFVAFDWDTRDKYDRLLAYIYTADGKCHNAQLIKEGYAHAYTRFPFQFLEEFRVLEKTARDDKKGLWRKEK
ncbi:MAG: hypothetical protein Ta2B_18910 [Termitinemataceae bacterium]|nr:MAG: hypothetical protein Ta2B_18910 [Termitinemataceae bacterium]